MEVVNNTYLINNSKKSSGKPNNIKKNQRTDFCKLYLSLKFLKIAHQEDLCNSSAEQLQEMRGVRFEGKHTTRLLSVFLLMKGGELQGEPEDQIQTH